MQSKGSEMMKGLIKKTLLLSSLIIMVVFLISWALFGYEDEIGLVMKLFGIAFLTNVVELIFINLHLENFLLEMVLENLIVTGIVLILGVWFGWFFEINWWMVFVYVTPVYVLAYILGITHIKKDVDWINEILTKNRGESDDE